MMRPNDTRESAAPLRALRAFTIAARSERLEDAARSLGVTKSAVSHLVRSLEDWLGQPVFQRTSKRPVLTETGRVLLEGCMVPLSRIEQVCEAVRRSADPSRIIISAGPAFASFRLMPLLADLNRNHPELEVEVRLVRYDAEPESNGVDVAIRFLNEHPTASRIGSLGWSVVCAPGFYEASGRPKSARAIQGGLLLHEQAFNFWPSVFENAGADVPPMAQYQGLGDSTHVLSAALSGAGFAILPHELTEGLRREGTLVCVFRALIEPDAGYFCFLGSMAGAKPRVKELLRSVGVSSSQA